jgi:hypothetical protein
VAAAVIVVGLLLALGGGGGGGADPTETETEEETETETEDTPTPGPTTVSIFRLVEGDCFNTLEGGDPNEVELVDCADDHEFETLRLFTVDEDGDYPGQQFFRDFAAERCPEGTDDFLAPSENTWEQFDDREVICLETGEDTPTPTPPPTQSGGEIITAFDLETGHCFLDLNGDFSQLQLVLCDGDLDYEVLSVFNVADQATFPGDEFLGREGDNRCPRGTDRHLRPSEATWATGDREIVCLRDG